MYIKYYINNKALYETERKREEDALRAVGERGSAFNVFDELCSSTAIVC